MIRKLFFRRARLLSTSPQLGQIIGLGFRHLSSLLPVSRVSNNDRVVGFFHPWPAFDEHILIVPKKAIPTFQALLSQENVAYLDEVLKTAREIIASRGWNRYSLGVNAGAYQDVAQVHFHLYKEIPHWRPLEEGKPLKCVMKRGAVSVFDHPHPQREVHLILCSDSGFDGARTFRGIGLALSDVLEQFPVVQTGYTVFFQFQDLLSNREMVLHIVSGETI